MRCFLKDLTVVIPVYNEEAIISTVIEDWIDHLKHLNIDSAINAYNDGSTDQSLELLRELEPRHPELNVIDKPNSGHGPTILKGYREANSKWIFQVDSDNEMKAKDFVNLWKNRKKYDFLIGIRENRDQAITRKIVSAISRITVKLFYGQGVTDVNSPYRLIRKSKFEEIFDKIPKNTFAPNVIISGMAANKNMKIYENLVPIEFRTTGEVSIKKWKLLKAAIKSWWQTVRFAWKEI